MTKALLVAAAFLVSGCASMRGVDVGTDTANTYSIMVTNQRSSAVTITYNDGEGVRELGSVGARDAERFIIAAPRSTSVTVRAVNSAGSQVGLYTVALEAGVTKQITVR